MKRERETFKLNSSKIDWLPRKYYTFLLSFSFSVLSLSYSLKSLRLFHLSLCWVGSSFFAFVPVPEQLNVCGNENEKTFFSTRQPKKAFFFSVCTFSSTWLRFSATVYFSLFKHCLEGLCWKKYKLCPFSKKESSSFICTSSFVSFFDSKKKPLGQLSVKHSLYEALMPSFLVGWCLSQSFFICPSNHKDSAPFLGSDWQLTSTTHSSTLDDTSCQYDFMSTRLSFSSDSLNLSSWSFLIWQSKERPLYLFNILTSAVFMSIYLNATQYCLKLLI